MSLTSEQVVLLRSSWQTIGKLGMSNVGLAVLHRLFNDVPETLPFFHSVLSPTQGTEIDVLKANAKVVRHATRVGLSIDKIINLLDNGEELVKYLLFLGKVHVKHSVPEKYFSAMGPVLLGVISTALEEDLDTPVMQAWATAYGVIKKGITAGM
ncbi:cytoglobin-1-like [Ciona intestinalis]